MCPARVDRLSVKEARQQPLLLNEGDRELLLAFSATRFLFSDHATRLLGTTRQAVHKRLMKLLRCRYIDRLAVTDRHYAYTLDVLGAEYVAEATGVPSRSLQRPRRWAVSTHALNHDLALADVYVALIAASRNNGIGLNWNKGMPSAESLFLAPGGRVRVEPSAFFSLVGPGLPSTLAFLEVDPQGSSLRKWQRKISTYSDYFLSEPLSPGLKTRPRVLVLVTCTDPFGVDTLRRFTATRWKAQLDGSPVPMGFIEHKDVHREDILTLPWVGLEEGAPIQLMGLLE